MLSQLKQDLLREYRKSNPSIIEGVQESNTGFDADALFRNIIKDLVNGTESLMGTSLLMEAQGELRDASAVAIKRADLLRLIADILSRQKELHQKAGEVDFNAPPFRLFQKLCLDKLIESLAALKVDNEMVTLILKEWQGRMSEWDKDLKKMIKEEEEK